jgi:hypothetical protein
MRAPRVPSHIYLVFISAMSMAVAAVIASVGESRAQADLNLQTQADIISAPFSLRQPQSIDTRPIVERRVERREVHTDNNEAIKQIFRDAIQKFQKFNLEKNIKSSTGKNVPKNAEACVKSQSAVNTCTETLKDHLSEEDRAKLTAFQPPGTIFVETKTNTIPAKQPTNVKFIFPFNPTYETNVFKSNTNVHPDTSFGFGGGWQVVTGVGDHGERPFDLVALSVGSASSRYTAFPSQSADVLTAQGFYQYFLGAYRGDGTLIVLPPAGAQAPAELIKLEKMITVQTVAVGIVNQTAFVPTYLHEKADFFTPQVTFARQNISLDANNKGCVDGNGVHNFCYFANLALTPAQTFSDVATLANANVAASATIGTRIDHTNLVAALATTVTGKAFEYVRGGRQDLLVQIGPNFQYGVNNCFNASLAVTYNRNYSTLTPAAWSGWVVQPTLNVIFPVPAMPDKSKTNICG